MKRRTLSFLLALTAAISFTVCPVAAADADATPTPAEEEKVPEDIQVTLDSGEITITNNTEIAFSGASYEKAEKTEGTEETWNLVLTEDSEEAAEHTFENVTPDQWTEPHLEEEWGCLYIYYKSETGADEEALETGEEKELEEKVTIYATTDVNVREEASTESKSLKVTTLGAEWTAVAGVPGWVKVEGEDVTGYIFHSYVTDDKAKVDELVKAAQEAAAAAAAAAQSQSSSSSGSSGAAAPAPQEPAPEAVYEVSRQAYDDCDGSGHGYWEILYSDGSVGYEYY